MGHTPSFDLILFGATGDLSMRKLLPNLYHAHADGLLNQDGRIIGVSRSALSSAEFRNRVAQEAKPHLGNHFSETAWESFLQRIEYVSVDATRPESFAALGEIVSQRSKPAQSTVIYLSTSPQFFTPICQALADLGLNGDRTRVVLEKPLGTDLISSQAINDAIGAFYREDQICRIDHYLGKEPLQNLLALRFANTLFEPIWNKQYIQSVQLTIAESLGVEGRGEFYDTIGALRDMVQNHLLQMLCLTAMEPPKSLAADDIRNSKLALLKALKPLNNVANQVVRGQYTKGEINGQPVPSYTEEKNVPPHSHTETYVALRAEIDNTRWQGVPFYLRTGKRMAAKSAEIIIQFRPLANALFSDGLNPPDRLIIELQPQECIRLIMQVKQTGSMTLRTTEMSVNLNSGNHSRSIDAYERLLLDAINGNLALFNRRDELEAAWQYVMPILTHWQQTNTPPSLYPAGSWGPTDADKLLQAGDIWINNKV